MTQLFEQFSVKHAKSGGGQYDSAEEFAASLRRHETPLNSQHKVGTWDGSVDSLLLAETSEELKINF